MDPAVLISLIVAVLTPILSTVSCTQLINFRLKSLEDKIESYDDIMERIARLETKVDMFHKNS